VKKRRITEDQARFLAISLINRVVNSVETGTKPAHPDEPREWVTAFFRNNLPEKWFDDQTSDQSWEHAWIEIMRQITIIIICLTEEQERILKENPTFRRVVQVG
jgi:hypothetical protein